MRTLSVMSPGVAGRTDVPARAVRQSENKQHPVLTFGAGPRRGVRQPGKIQRRPGRRRDRPGRPFHQSRPAVAHRRASGALPRIFPRAPGVSPTTCARRWTRISTPTRSRRSGTIGTRGDTRTTTAAAAGPADAARRAARGAAAAAAIPLERRATRLGVAGHDGQRRRFTTNCRPARSPRRTPPSTRWKPSTPRCAATGSRRCTARGSGWRSSRWRCLAFTAGGAGCSCWSCRR